MPHPHLTGGRPPNRAIISAGEFRALVNSFGVSQAKMGQFLGVTDRTIRNWLSGAVAAPKAVVTVLKVLQARMDAQRRKSGG